ncbi:hypothetical protein GCM10009801_39520 [Streptomyces albiaxialis]|uniref:Uncharacterized protein n=1 Tax=Streptomyces albiaxialis TaxID=329523 RepID=A0ABN2W3S0_9ACTN
MATITEDARVADTVSDTFRDAHGPEGWAVMAPPKATGYRAGARPALCHAGCGFDPKRAPQGRFRGAGNCASDHGEARGPRITDRGSPCPAAPGPGYGYGYG